ncbi:MAG: sugar phosphate isomerase/epimerase [Ignisphaera sp.]|nr:sugar phosphate isomerase/epimerase [Ignisphaera sp.]MCX8167759.1 sugar phosphate isomerase/epimerase [Ignisphaera sp.]MDW8085254.1 TIM barrel protein [Ignisphaera sp.]
MGRNMLYGYVIKDGHEIVAKFPWDVGIVAFMIFPDLMQSTRDFSERLKPLITDPFFDLIEMTPIADDLEWNKVVELNKSYRKKFALALQPLIINKGININAVDEQERRRAVEFVISEIRRAGMRGLKAVGLCSGPNVEGPNKEAATEALIKSLVEISSEASKYDMKVFLETFDTAWDRKRLAGLLPDTVRIVERVRDSAKNIYIMWDLSHAPLLNEDPSVLRSYPEFVGHIHIGCGKRVGDKLLDTHPGFYRPGALNTEVDVAKLLGVLHDIGYRGSISFEIRPEQDQNPFEVLNSGKGVLLRAFQLYLDMIL